MMASCKVVVTLESVDEILRYDHSNETYLAAHSHGTKVSLAFYKMKCGNFASIDLESEALGTCTWVNPAINLLILHTLFYRYSRYQFT